MNVLVPIVVVLDYAALSWFGTLATSSGHPEAAFRVGTVLFIALNAGVLLLSPRAWPMRMPRWTARLENAARRARWIAFAPIVALAVGYRLTAIARTPLDPAEADMLPLIIAASEKLLAGGNPYARANPFQAGIDPLEVRPASSALASATPEQWVAYVPAWLPALWLPYVPAVWAGVDVRLIGLATVLLTAALLGVARWSVETDSDRPVDRPTDGWLRLVCAGALLLAPAAVWFGAIGHTQTYWLYLTGLLWALSRRWWGLAGVGLGLAIMSRHTVLPILPVVALFVWRGLVPRERRRLVIAAAAVVLVLTLPFGIQGLWQFTIGSPTWYMRFGDQGWNGPRWWVTHTFGFSTFLYPLGWSRAIPWVGAALLAAVYGLAYRRVRDLESCVRSLALTLLVVQVSVPTPFRYEFFPIILVLSALPLLARARPDRAVLAA